MNVPHRVRQQGNDGGLALPLQLRRPSKARRGEVFLGQVEKGAAEGLDGGEDPRGILGAGAYPDVEVLGRPNAPVCCKRLLGSRYWLARNELEDGGATSVGSTMKNTP